MGLKSRRPPQMDLRPQGCPLRAAPLKKATVPIWRLPESGSSHETQPALQQRLAHASPAQSERNALAPAPLAQGPTLSPRSAQRDRGKLSPFDSQPGPPQGAGAVRENLG